MFRLILYSMFIVLFSACLTESDDYKNVPEEIEGWKPVYFKDTGDISKLIYSTTPRPILKTGKIYIYQHFLFVGEYSKGVHVFENSNPNLPVPLAFINIPYNFDIAIRDTVLYADTYVGLVALGIARIPEISFLSLIPNLSNKMPSVPASNWSSKTYFECLESDKGIVVEWERAVLNKPKCYKLQ